jgi:hypothetical protein
LLRSWDPRRNAALDPSEWAAVARIQRLRLSAALAIVAAVLVGVAAYVWYPVDHTRDLTPAAVVEKAGLALLQAGHYRFRADLSGKAEEYPFPDAALAGEFQREPRRLHLTGAVLSGETRVPLEYWVDGSVLYLYHPTLKHWLKVSGTVPEELASFYPENLAAPLVGGVRTVQEVGRERLAGGQAVQYRLGLDPSVMLPGSPELQQDGVEYRLWVYTRSLEPARFSVQVSRQPASDNPVQSTHFSYSLTWEFRREGALTVPADVLQAEEVGELPDPYGDADAMEVVP